MQKVFSGDVSKVWLLQYASNQLLLCIAFSVMPGKFQIKHNLHRYYTANVLADEYRLSIKSNLHHVV